MIRFFIIYRLNYLQENYAFVSKGQRLVDTVHFFTAFLYVYNATNRGGKLGKQYYWSQAMLLVIVCPLMIVQCNHFSIISTFCRVRRCNKHCNKLLKVQLLDYAIPQILCKFYCTI